MQSGLEHTNHHHNSAMVAEGLAGEMFIISMLLWFLLLFAVFVAAGRALYQTTQIGAELKDINNTILQTIFNCRLFRLHYDFKIHIFSWFRFLLLFSRFFFNRINNS